MQENTLLRHLLELLSQGKGHFGDHEALKNGANGLENHDIEHTLYVLLDHVTDHVGIRHHLSHLVELDFLLKVACVLGAEVCLSLLHALLRQEIGMFANST